MILENYRYRDILKKGGNILRQAGVADWGTDAWYLLSYVASMDRASYFMNSTCTIPEKTAREYLDLIKYRAGRIPLQYITGTQEFMGLEFHVTPDVLIPRQDTETLVEYLLPYVKDRTVLDMCTGTGCIAIALMKLGGAASCVAVDCSEKAIKVAKENSAVNGVDIQFVQSDMFTDITGKYDIIVSNPPYIRTGVIKTLMPEVREHEPFAALDGGSSGLDFYRIISSEAGKYLEKGGILAVETGYDQGNDVSCMFKECGFKDVCIRKDLSGNDRVVAAVKP